MTNANSLAIDYIILLMLSYGLIVMIISELWKRISLTVKSELIPNSDVVRLTIIFIVGIAIKIFLIVAMVSLFFDHIIHNSAMLIVVLFFVFYVITLKRTSLLSVLYLIFIFLIFSLMMILYPQARHFSAML